MLKSFQECPKISMRNMFNKFPKFSLKIMFGSFQKNSNVFQKVHDEYV